MEKSTDISINSLDIYIYRKEVNPKSNLSFVSSVTFRYTMKLYEIAFKVTNKGKITTQSILA